MAAPHAAHAALSHRLFKEESPANQGPRPITHGGIIEATYTNSMARIPLVIIHPTRAAIFADAQQGLPDARLPCDMAGVSWWPLVTLEATSESMPYLDR